MFVVLFMCKHCTRHTCSFIWLHIHMHWHAHPVQWVTLHNIQASFRDECPYIHIVSQATPFVERKGLVTLQLSSCRRETQLSNIVVRSAEHSVTLIVLHDNGYNLRRVRIWFVTSSFCCGDNSMVAVWPDPSLLCEGCGLRDYLAIRSHDHNHRSLLTIYQETFEEQKISKNH